MTNEITWPIVTIPSTVVVPSLILRTQVYWISHMPSFLLGNFVIQDSVQWAVPLLWFIFFKKISVSSVNPQMFIGFFQKISIPLQCNIIAEFSSFTPLPTKPFQKYFCYFPWKIVAFNILHINNLGISSNLLLGGLGMEL